MTVATAPIFTPEATPHVATCTLKGVSPYCQGRPFSTADQEPGERHDEYEKKNWRRRQHVNKDGVVIIPALALKNCLAEAAKFISMKVPGAARSTYTKHFEAGVMVPDAAPLGIKGKDVEPFEMFVPSNGRRGDGCRVHKFFPVIDDWEATATFIVLDAAITEEVFKAHIVAAGRFIGLGSFRVRNNGIWGRFDVISFDWSEWEA